MRNVAGVMVLETGDRALLHHPSAGDTVWTIRSMQANGTCDIENPWGAQLRCQVGDLVPVTLTPLDHHRHRTADPDTSVAAVRDTAGHLTHNQFVVLDALHKAGTRGMLDHDHQPVNGLQQDSAGKRRKELADMGFVADSGQRRRTPRGSRAIVWTITATGVAYHRTEQQRRGAA